LISLPRPTQMLHFGQFALPSASKGVYREISFGNPGINGRMHLPQAYRSLPRPSSLTKPSHSPTGVFARLIPSHSFSKSRYPLQRLVMSIKICFDTFLYACLCILVNTHTRILYLPLQSNLLYPYASRLCYSSCYQMHTIHTHLREHLYILL
jgi:hypothetical protein